MLDATAPDGLPRCSWCVSSDDYIAYHDQEWGFPVGDDRRLYEKMCLEGFQSGLSWLTILRKREAFRRAFHDFDMESVASMGAADVDRLLGDATIVRHRGKIEAAIANARAALDVAEESGSLAAFVWAFEPGSSDPTRSTSPESSAMARELKKRGFRFVGPTTAYAFMQSMGIVNDHIEGCTTHGPVEAARAQFSRPSARTAPFTPN